MFFLTWEHEHATGKTGNVEEHRFSSAPLASPPKLVIHLQGIEVPNHGLQTSSGEQEQAVDCILMENIIHLDF